MRRRSAAIEPIIGHTKNEHRMDRNYLAGRNGDANNAILAAVGYLPRATDIEMRAKGNGLVTLAAVSFRRERNSEF